MEVELFSLGSDEDVFMPKAAGTGTGSAVGIINMDDEDLGKFPARADTLACGLRPKSTQWTPDSTT